RSRCRDIAGTTRSSACSRLAPSAARGHGVFTQGSQRSRRSVAAGRGPPATLCAPCDPCVETCDPSAATSVIFSEREGICQRAPLAVLPRLGGNQLPRGDPVNGLRVVKPLRVLAAECDQLLRLRRRF